MNPYISPEGSYEIGSVLWSTFRQFSWNWLISFFVFFFETLHCVRSPDVDVLDRADFSRKTPHWAKMTKNGCSTRWANFHSSLFLLCVHLDHADTSHLALNCSKLTGCYMICKNAENVEHLGYWLRMCHSLCHFISYILLLFCNFFVITDKLCWYTNKNKVIMKL